ncbi:DUF5655 domain-containing protein [Microcella sp.]|uniref:DUF5655 domain-containing protein n=1 Tax=Microcella sp. TaxID=1913979 RepID=UPI00255D343F|nr:DUF5655 domain-containing protein [Microcella sp.]MBX9471600.1 DUF4287 domain-containing protein [Microcella sp.]
MDDATKKLIESLPEKTGRSLEQWSSILDRTGLEKHGQLLAHLKSAHGVTHGFANSIALLHRERGIERTDDDLVDGQYAGAKAGLRPLHDRLVEIALSLGGDVEIAPKRTSVSLRRRKQFALIEPASAQRIALGLNLGDAPASERLLAVKGMCTHRVDVRTLDDIDDELVNWLRGAYELG